MLTHFLLRRKISAYLDDELTPARSKAVERHLGRCKSCQMELNEIREGKKLATYFQQPNWNGSERLWANLKNATTPHSRVSDSEWPFRLTWPAASNGRVRLALTVAAIAGVLFLSRQFTTNRPIGMVQDGDGRWPLQTASALSIDFGLYLDALTKGQPPVEFERRYGSQMTSYENAKAVSEIPLPAAPPKPEAFTLSGVHVLRSSCCHSIQLECSNESGRIVIFRQPRDHPATFGSYDLTRVRMNGRNCLRVEIGNWTALCWDDENSQYVVMSDLSKKELANALLELM